MVPPPQMVVLPEQMVGQDGSINVPFVGHVLVSGHDPAWIERNHHTRIGGQGQPTPGAGTGDAEYHGHGGG
ncbi:Polysaccharide biosynthesis/export protein (fragment) [mine drainage metagenome]